VPLLAQVDWSATIPPLLIGTVPAVVAAIVAAASAIRVGRLQDDAAHVRDLESRLAEKKYKVYEPLINNLGKILTPGGADKLDTKRGQAELTAKIGGSSSLGSASSAPMKQ
jgi:hypothetical protein